MTVGLLLITHGKSGEALLSAARGTLGPLPVEAQTLSVTQASEPEHTLAEARALCRRLDSGGGVLVLTDVFGATPCNIATRLLGNSGVRVLAGLNLPMLLRVFNYPDLALDALAVKALSGGRDGIILCDRPESQTP
jgi:mannose PTS system EIIA component